MVRFMSDMEYEELDVKVKELEERVMELEKGLDELTEETRSVLMDVRNVISELDNPLNYIKELGLSGLVESTIEDKLQEFMSSKLKDIIKDIKKTVPQEKIEDSLKEPIKQFKDANIKQFEVNKEGIITKYPFIESEPLKLLICAGCLLYLFGKKGAEKVLDDYSMRGWISNDIKTSLTRVLSMLNADRIPDNVDIRIEDHLIAMCILSKLDGGGPISELFAMFLLLTRGVKFVSDSHI